MSNPSDPLRLSDLIARARAQDATGDLEGAAASCRALLERQADHPFALSLLANLALRAGKMTEAISLCEKAVASRPEDPVLRLNLGMTRIRAGDDDRAISDLRRATEIKPDLAMAHFYAGAVLKRRGEDEAAVAAWCDAFNAEPSLQDLYRHKNASPELQQISLMANGVIRDAHRARHLSAVAPFREQMNDDARKRLDAFLDHFHGLRQVAWADPLQRPTYMYYPGLPARPWYEREEFDWTPGFESSAAAIAEECKSVMRIGEDLEPYLDHIPSAPPQMRELMGSTQWSSYHLLARGEREEAHCRACPQTDQALRSMPLPVGENQSPEAFFSILKPDTHIPPHFGVANTKVVVHLALIIPDGCALRAGDETRQWSEGQCLIFDDSFEHEAWNKGTGLRAVLITEVWNPGLTQPERDALVAVLAATAEWHRYSGGDR